MGWKGQERACKGVGGGQRRRPLGYGLRASPTVSKESGAAEILSTVYEHLTARAHGEW